MKIAVCLISGIIAFSISAFFGYFMLPLGLLGASSEKMVNASFLLFIVWIVISPIAAMIFSFKLVNYFIEKTSVSDPVAAVLTIAIFLASVVIFNFIIWVLTTIIGNIR